MNPAGHQKVPGAFRRAAHEHGGFDFDKPIFIKIVAGDLGDLVAHEDIFLQIRPPQVEIPVFQPQILFHVGMFHNFKRRRFGFIQNPQFGHINFHIAGGNLIGFSVPFPYDTAGGQHKFRPARSGFAENFGIGGIVKRQLHNARAVAQINKDQTAQIPLALYPTKHRFFLSDMFHAKLSAIMSAAEPRYQFCHLSFPPVS